MSDHQGAKAISLLQRGGVVARPNASTYLAKASTGDGWHVVTLNARPTDSPEPRDTCTCQAGREGVGCYHVRAARLDLHRNGRQGAPAAGAARSSDPQTSKRAAASGPGRKGTQRRRVFDAIVGAGMRGRTADEVARRTGIIYRSVTPRIAELKRAGLIEASGGTRRSDSEHEMEVLVATEAGALPVAA